MKAQKTETEMLHGSIRRLIVEYFGAKTKKNNSKKLPAGFGHNHFGAKFTEFFP
jgi:hypothetical protein